MVDGEWWMVPIGKFSSYVHQLLCTGARCENTEDSEDVDRIEGIDYIGELLSDRSPIDSPLPTLPSL